MRIKIFATYFGELPPYFPLWLKSCQMNSGVDFVLLTNNRVDNLPKNVEVCTVEFKNFCNYISNTLNMDVRIDNPYKLCDFRPAFGEIFKDMLNGYDYWGHCDLDVIFGDLKMFFCTQNIGKYQRFLNKGHLSLYKNEAAMNRLFRSCIPGIPSYEEIFTTPVHFAFDEGIMDKIMEHRYITVFRDRIYADISPRLTRFTLALNDLNYKKQFFYWDNGKVFRLYSSGREIVREEFIYIHFQKRGKLYCAVDPLESRSFSIGPNGFFSLDTTESFDEKVNRLNPYHGVFFERLEKTAYRLKEKLK
ncbi:uncharacterized protein BN613_00709 [Cryptobacterium sp. CAG:338]|nr:uncharacterized protein BN613_00709 [Cryptobacterium sp. CAG:338]